jgi:uncharacterized protein HemX
MKRFSKVLAVMVAAVFLLGAATSFAETEWQKQHPRRNQVNKRLNRQDKRINKKVKEGKMSKAEANKLHQQDRNIRQEERDMAQQNGGHITKQEQRTLNRQENQTSREIGK